MAQFEPIFKRTLSFEDGPTGEYFYSNTKGDPGGETVHGIARNMNPDLFFWKIVDFYRAKPGFPKNMKGQADIDAAVLDFYLQDEWAKIRGDEIASQDMAMHLYDSAVNQGIGRAVKTLQKALNNESEVLRLLVDGVIGDLTIGAVNTFCQVPQQEQALIKEFRGIRMAFYRQLSAERPQEAWALASWLARS